MQSCSLFIHKINPIFPLDKGIMSEYTVYIVYVQYDNRGDGLDIIISNASNQPIYEQIYLQIKSNIISGALNEGELLPSIRSLAKDLRISVITTKRAYDELEKDGYIHTVAAKGCFVAPKNTELIREEHLKQIEEHMRKIIELAPACELSDAELLDMLRTIQTEK